MKRILLKSTILMALACPTMAFGADTAAPADTTKPATKSPDAPNTDTAKKDTKGRLPRFYSKIVDDAERQKIYDIQKEFEPKMKDLRAQIDAMVAERDKQIKAVLTPDQQKKLEDMIAEAKTSGRGRGRTRGPRPVDTATKPTDTTSKPGETTAKPIDPAAKPADPAPAK